MECAMTLGRIDVEQLDRKTYIESYYERLGNNAYYILRRTSIAGDMVRVYPSKGSSD